MPPCAYCSARPSASAAIVCFDSSSTSVKTSIPTMLKTKPAPAALNARKASASLKAVVRKILPSAVTNHVSRAADRVEQRRIEVFIDLGAQSRDMHVDHIGLRIEVIVPNALEQHGPGDDLAGVLHQIFEQTKLARLQRDFDAAAGDLVRQAIELEIGNAIDRLLACPFRPAPRQRVDAGEQFGEGVGLGDRK